MRDTAVHLLDQIGELRQNGLAFVLETAALLLRFSIPGTSLAFPVASTCTTVGTTKAIEFGLQLVRTVTEPPQSPSIVLVPNLDDTAIHLPSGEWSPDPRVDDRDPRVASVHRPPSPLLGCSLVGLKALLVNELIAEVEIPPAIRAALDGPVRGEGVPFALEGADVGQEESTLPLAAKADLGPVLADVEPTNL